MLNVRDVMPRLFASRSATSITSAPVPLATPNFVCTMSEIESV
jgi:hypothetical protein